MEPKLVKALEGGAGVVASTRRLARRLVGLYDAAQERAGRACWPSASILPWRAWVGALWESTWPQQAVLSDPVALALWEEAVAADASARGIDLLDVPATARAAREAYDLIQLYEIPFRPGRTDAPEPQALERWIRAYESRLGESDWTDSSTLPSRVAEAVEVGSVDVPRSILLAGFDEVPPAHARLLSSLVARGTRVERLPFPDRQSRVSRHCAGNGRGEVRSAALWVRRLLEGGDLPAGRVGVVVVSLEAYADWIEQTFTEELTPGAVLPGSAPVARPFDLSYGAPLSREPLAATALDLLGLGSGFADWELWTSLLRSPFWGGEGESLGRAALDAALSRRRGTAWRISDVARMAAEAALVGTSAALDRLAALLAGPPEPSGLRRPSEWAQQFVSVLKAVGWSSARTLTSREYQAQQALLEAIGRMRTFDVLGQRVNRKWALDRLQRLCTEPFRAEAAEGVVPVLGTLEAAGLEFDHLWVLGLHARAFPPEPRPNPFLPYLLQVRCGVRQASPEAQLERAQTILRRLTVSAREVVLSHPQVWEDAEVGPSPLIRGYPLADARAHAASLVASLRRRPEVLETVEDRAPPLESHRRAPGGASLLADQAACPFRAFVRHRLGADAPAAPDEVLDPLERGIGLHAALDRFWAMVGSQEALRSMSAQEVQDTVARAVEAGLDVLEEGRPRLSGRVKELEGRWLAELLGEWLCCELEREPFAVVGRETDREVEVGGLTLRVRVDRVDETAGGRQVLVDYKTGRPEPARWFEDRPREPQLPLYALACPEARGVCYAVVRRGECGFKRVVDSGEGLEGPRSLPEEIEGWEELVDRWRDRLGRLATEVREGRADVFPLDADVCRYCELPSLCRIGEPLGEGPQDHESPRPPGRSGGQ